MKEPKAKYEQLMFYGKNLKPLDTWFQTRENKVEGCVPQVWVRSHLDEHKNVVYEADSDSVLTRGLAALLENGWSERPVEETLRAYPDFAVLLGPQQSLTPSRNNGFLNMLKLMQRKALELLVKAEKVVGSPNSGSNCLENRSSGGSSIWSFSSHSGSENLTSEKVSERNSRTSSNWGGLGSRGMRMKEKLEKELNPIELDVEDISYQRVGHAGVRGSNVGERHFNVRIVSKQFSGKSLIKRYRLIYDLLHDELHSGLHALSIMANTPSEADARGRK